ncbi:hypothetical protein E3P92_02902 [Wallemia ichthyophaga]|nr:hypothetical protein E3P92_02902 [Wallemia ichthyophaga]TIB62334.1 hypothetical protein E3P78_02375 [Wallemia ichthyophaga]
MNVDGLPPYTRTRIQSWYAKHKAQKAHKANKTHIRGSLREKTCMTLTLLAPAVIGTLFVIISIAASRASIDDITESATSAVDATCQNVQNRAEDAVNMPLTAQRKLGQQVQDTTTSAISGLERVLLLLLKAIPIVVIFFIDFYRSLLLCFLQLVVQTALAAVTELVRLATSAIEDVAHSIGDLVSSAFDSANNAIDTINDLISWSGESVGHIDAPSLDALNNFEMPASVQDTLNEANENLPDLQDLRDYLEGVILTPFQNLSDEVSDKFASYKNTASATNAAATKQDAHRLTFCSDMDLSLISDLGHAIKKMGLWLIVALTLFTFVYCIVLAYVERRRYRRRKEIIEEYDYGSDPKRLAELISSHSNPYVYKWTRRMPALRRDGIRWTALVVSHPYPITLLSIGAMGALSTGVQYAVVDRIQDSFVSRARSAYDAAESKLNQSLTTATYTGLSNTTNDAIGNIENAINDDIFGWLDDGIVPINNTLTSFEEGLNSAIETAFNGTFLEDPISNYVQCIVGSKLDTLESGLTWIHNNANVNLLRVPDDLFDVSTTIANAMNPLRNTIVGNRSTGEEGESYKRQLKASLIIFAVLLGLYVLVIVVAAAAATVLAIKRRHEIDPDDESQYVMLREVEVDSTEAGAGGDGSGGEKNTALSTTADTVNLPTAERTTIIIPSPAYSNHAF